MTRREELASGIIAPNLGLGDIVVDAEQLNFAHWSEVNKAIASLAIGKDTTGLHYSRFDQHKVVIPTRNCYFDNHTAIRALLEGYGIRYAICGTRPNLGSKAVVSNPSEHQQAVAEWEGSNAARVNTGYLEQIFIGQNFGAVGSYITSRTLKKVFAQDDSTEEYSRAVAIRAGNMYNRLTKIAEHRGARAHLMTGMVFFGNPLKNALHKWCLPQWGITPAAFYGMTLESDTTPEFGFGKRGAENARELLEFISVS